MHLLAHLFAFGLAVAALIEAQQNNWTTYYPDNACAGPGQMSLEFQGDPSPMYTAGLLDALTQQNISATFYVNPMLDDGFNIAIMKRIVALGHTLGITVDMRNTTMSYIDLQIQIYNGLMQFQQNVGVIPRFIAGNLSIYDWVFTQMGFVQQRRPLYLRANNSICFSGETGAFTYIKILNETVQNNIPGRSYAPRALLPCNSTGFVNQVSGLVRNTWGYKFVTVEECLAMPGKYMMAPPIIESPVSHSNRWTPTPTPNHDGQGHDDENSGFSDSIKWYTISLMVSIIVGVVIFWA